MDSPLVSIVIATYNHGKYLPETIGSVLDQSYENIEVIVVDDGSTDDTVNIVKNYPVKYIYQKNQGPSRAFNVGINMAHGEFYVTPGADDKLHPDYVRLCLQEILKDSRTGFVWTGAQEFGASHDVRIPVPLHNRFSIYRGPGGQLGAAMFSKKAFNEVGGYDEKLPVYEDWDLAIRILKAGWKGRCISDPIYYWRRHNVSRNTQAPTKVLQKELQKKYPMLSFYRQLGRFFDFCYLAIHDPKESLRRVYRKMH